MDASISRRLRKATILLVGVLVWAMPLAAKACPNCKLSVQDTDGGAVQGVTGAVGNMAAGYAYSIYLMLAVPLVLVTSLVFFIRRQVRILDAATPADPHPAGLDQNTV